MHQVIQSYKNGRIFLAEVPAPACKAGGVLVRTAASLISPGTEKLIIEMGRKSLLGKARARPDLVRQAWAKARKEGLVSVFREARHRLDEPVPLGYSAAGVVLEVGAGVTGFQAGDRVAMAGAGYASHAEIIWTPANLCTPIPAGVAFEVAAFVMLGGIALHGVREANLTLGERAVVLGLGLLGLLTVQLLRAQGCRVVGVDLDREKGQLARELGADLALIPGEDHIEEAVANFTRARGADAIIITAASRDNGPLLLAEAVARQRARVVLVGMAELGLTRQAFWDKELTFSVSKAAGPGSLDPLYEAKGFDYPVGWVRWTEGRNLAAFLDLVAQGKVRVDRLITHRFAISEALKAYDLILNNREPNIGVLLTYPQSEAGLPTDSRLSRKVWLTGTTALVGKPGPADRLSVGLIGGGLFAKNILLPALKQTTGVRLVAAATTTGVSARHLAQKYDFAYATTDYREILDDTAIGSVIITTRHHNHASLVLEALKAGKHVLVEKPLCLTAEELAEIRKAYNGSRLLMVGFNRRFAPLTQKVRARLAGRTTPLVMVYRVNAGYIPDHSWVHDPGSGGGRLLGEVCHFIDLLQLLCEARAVQAGATPVAGALGKYRGDDNLILNLSFADGTIGAIIYTAKGSKAFSRERLEVFGEESVAVIEDFRRAWLVRGGKVEKIHRFSMDMGYRAEMEFFLNCSPEDQNFGDLFESYAAATLAALKANEALLTGRTVAW